METLSIFQDPGGSMLLTSDLNSMEQTLLLLEQVLTQLHDINRLTNLLWLLLLTPSGNILTVFDGSLQPKVRLVI